MQHPPLKPRAGKKPEAAAALSAGHNPENFSATAPFSERNPETAAAPFAERNPKTAAAPFAERNPETAASAALSAGQNFEAAAANAHSVEQFTESTSETPLPGAVSGEGAFAPSLEAPSENPIGEGQSVQVARGTARIVLTISVNLLVLAQVFIAMYFAAKTPDALTPVFFKTLFGMLLPTLLLAFVARRIIDRRKKS